MCTRRGKTPQLYYFHWLILNFDNITIHHVTISLRLPLMHFGERTRDWSWSVWRHKVSCLHGSEKRLQLYLFEILLKILKCNLVRTNLLDVSRNNFPRRVPNTPCFSEQSLQYILCFLISRYPASGSIHHWVNLLYGHFKEWLCKNILSVGSKCLLILWMDICIAIVNI